MGVLVLGRRRDHTVRVPGDNPPDSAVRADALTRRLDDGSRQVVARMDLPVPVRISHLIGPGRPVMIAAALRAEIHLVLIRLPRVVLRTVDPLGRVLMGVVVPLIVVVPVVRLRGVLVGGAGIRVLVSTLPMIVVNSAEMIVLVSIPLIVVTVRIVGIPVPVSTQIVASRAHRADTRLNHLDRVMGSVHVMVVLGRVLMGVAVPLIVVVLAARLRGVLVGGAGIPGLGSTLLMIVASSAEMIVLVSILLIVVIVRIVGIPVPASTQIAEIVASRAHRADTRLNHLDRVMGSVHVMVVLGRVLMGVAVPLIVVVLAARLRGVLVGGAGIPGLGSTLLMIVASSAEMIVLVSILLIVVIVRIVGIPVPASTQIAEIVASRAHRADTRRDLVEPGNVMAIVGRVLVPMGIANHLVVVDPAADADSTVKAPIRVTADTTMTHLGPRGRAVINHASNPPAHRMVIAGAKPLIVIRGTMVFIPKSLAGNRSAKTLAAMAMMACATKEKRKGTSHRALNVRKTNQRPR